MHRRFLIASLVLCGVACAEEFTHEGLSLSVPAGWAATTPPNGAVVLRSAAESKSAIAVAHLTLGSAKSHQKRGDEFLKGMEDSGFTMSSDRSVTEDGVVLRVVEGSVQVAPETIGIVVWLRDFGTSSVAVALTSPELDRLRENGKAVALSANVDRRSEANSPARRPDPAGGETALRRAGQWIASGALVVLGAGVAYLVVVRKGKASQQERRS